jgi:phage-related protein (TIGR01555 family)
MAKVSIKSVARAQKREQREAAKRTQDSFQNFALGLGIGTGNPSTGNTYGYNPITRIRTELEWMYRGAWLAGTAVDVIADDMTREGVELTGDIDPDDIAQIEERATTLRIWERTGQAIKWGRLYGGSIAVLLISGQNYSTKFNIDTVGPGQFAGLFVLDRWMVDPSLNDLVTDIGPELGTPKFYIVNSSAPALRGQKIHYSRIIRFNGDELPYWQAVAENLWSASVLERPFPIVSQYDSATAGASQMVSKAYLRYFKVKGYRDIIGGLGGIQAMQGLQNMVATMRGFASNEGITLMDAEDDMVTTQSSVFTGMGEILLQIAQQISGAFQIPLVRLLGQSPGGLNSTGDGDMKTYNDGIKRRQQCIKVPTTIIYRCIAQSEGIELGDGFGVSFRPLWQMDELQKAEIAEKDMATALALHESGTISDQTFLKEVQHSSEITGRGKSITEKEIEAASEEVIPPPEMQPGLPLPPGAKIKTDPQEVKADANAA